jgi:NAD-dependent SIR2 family protein deacetylase
VTLEEKLEKATQWLRDADGLLITAGAGLGVDSGLPDFCGAEGFWRAYPALQHHGLSFEDMANPASFSNDPTLAWEFYGHRLALYRKTEPHPGFDILRKWGDRMQYGAFAFTSNVDGQFQKTGFLKLAPPIRLAVRDDARVQLHNLKPIVGKAGHVEMFCSSSGILSSIPKIGLEKSGGLQCRRKIDAGMITQPTGTLCNG